MAARLLKRHDEQTRSKIQASHIINHLTEHVKGEREMTATQVRAAEILLKKSLPDLQSVSVTTEDEDGNTVPMNINITFRHANAE